MDAGRIIVRSAKKEGSSSMKKIALTGGIGSGKSTVARMMRMHHIPVIDADKVVHELYRDPKIIGMLTALFGSEINESGVINRKRLGNIIFHNETEKERLNQFFMPRIHQCVQEKFKYYENQGIPAVVYDAALIYEWGIEADFDSVIVVDAPLLDRVTRICMRDHLTEAEAEARIHSQMDLAKKVELADIVIENDGDFSHLQKQAQDIIQALIG